MKQLMFVFMTFCMGLTAYAQTPAKACCAKEGATTNASAKACDPKACAPKEGSASTDASAKACVPKEGKACCASGATSSVENGVPSLTPEAFRKAYKKAKNRVLLDVRTPDEFGEAHLKKAKNIDYKDENFEEKISQLDKSKNYYVYCKSGVRTAAAVEVMQKQGFSHVFVLDGGLLAWQEMKLPVAK
ncbi:MAG: rhodanese-like domain-containing protein [Saprospiraceae bacterium]|nr:rhodanese-like domain-containing protein [Saprospiraceae bacterium]